MPFLGKYDIIMLCKFSRAAGFSSGFSFAVIPALSAVPVPFVRRLAAIDDTFQGYAAGRLSAVLRFSRGVFDNIRAGIRAAAQYF